MWINIKNTFTNYNHEFTLIFLIIESLSFLLIDIIIVNKNKGFKIENLF